MSLIKMVKVREVNFQGENRYFAGFVLFLLNKQEAIARNPTFVFAIF